jgi:glycosyltransferase involved in cell wall biosynthesis
MKIACIHALYAPHTRGGAEVVVDTIVSGFRHAGDDVFVISVGRGSVSEVVDGVLVYRVASWNIFHFLDIAMQSVWKRFVWHIVDMFNIPQAIRIYRVLKQEVPDVVYTHSLKGLGYIVPMVVRLLGIRHIHTVHDMQLLSPTGVYRGDSFRVSERLYARVCAWLFWPVNTVVFPSEYMRRMYKDQHLFMRAQCVVIPNPMRDVGVVIRESMISDTVRLLYLGQVEEYKGIYLLLNALKQVPGAWSLVVVGDGTGVQQAKEIAKNMSQVTFVGRIPHTDLTSIWSQTDLLVHPSMVAESFGMNVVEAYRAGVPVVASRMGALLELVEVGSTGWLFDPHRIDELVEILTRVIAKPQVLSEMSRLCRNRVAMCECNMYIQQVKALV